MKLYLFKGTYLNLHLIKAIEHNFYDKETGIYIDIAIIFLQGFLRFDDVTKKELSDLMNEISKIKSIDFKDSNQCPKIKKS